MILGIDHVGLVTEDPAGVGQFMAALGMNTAEQGLVEAYGVSCEFWQYSQDPREPAVELVAPVRHDAAVVDYLCRNGPGLYHIAFEVDNLEDEMTRLRGNGVVPVDSEPREGARPGMRVAFMYLPKPAGLLIELVRYAKRRR